MTLTITLDWLAFTFKEDSQDVGTWLHTFASNQEAIPIAPTNGYGTAYRTRHKVDVMWNIDRPEMGYHVIITGTAIRNICEHMELDQKALVESVVNAGASITRLDLAKDLKGHNLSLDEIYQEMEAGKRTGTARKIAQIHSNNGGNTIYVGSRQSEKFIRIYDKNAEQGRTGELWYRFELEAKGQVARTLVHILLDGTGWDSAFDTVTRYMVDLPNNRQWQLFYSTDTAEVGFPKIEKSSDREKWIDTQVTPAVVKHYMNNRHSEAIKKLRTMLDFVDKGNENG